MKDLSSAPGIDNVTSGYLNGKLKDGETLVGEFINNDIAQFFQKLMNLASLSPNENYDNETNGYQLIDALQDFVKTKGVFLQKIIEIGDWNMDATITLNKAHGLDFDKILEVSVLIRNDANTLKVPLNKNSPTTGPSTGEFTTTSTNIEMIAYTSGYFDSVDYDSTSYNRGWIIIQYIL